MKKYQLAITAIVLLAALTGCTASQETAGTDSAAASETSPTDLETSAPTVEGTSSQKLQFSVVESEGPGYTVISQEELGEKTGTEIVYGDLKEVKLAWDGQTIPLAQAIRGGKLTVP